MSKSRIFRSRFLLVLCLCVAQHAIAQSQLRVGASRVDITPSPDSSNPPSGRYAHEKLYARAIVLDNGATRAALIGTDQGGLSEVIWQAASKEIAAELNCPVANIIMSATHTHSAWGPGGFRALTDSSAPPPPIIGQMVDAVRQAKAKLQPARVGFGTGKSYLNVNRDAIDPETHLWTQAPNLDGPSDKTVAVVEFVATSGEPIAVYMDYGMHPVNGFLSGITSADFAGAASRYVEEAFQDKPVAIFAQGASGDQNPLYLRAATNAMAARSGVPVTGFVLSREPVEAPIRDQRVNAGPLDPRMRDQLERVMDSEGVLLGEEVIRVMTNTKRLDAAPSIAGQQNTVTCPGRKRTDTGREGKPGTYVDGEPVEIRLGALRIGTVALTWVDAEIYTPIGQRLKRESPMANTVLVTLANGRADSGYIPNDTAFGAYTFQVLGSKLKPGCAETAIVNGLVDLIAATEK